MHLSMSKTKLKRCVSLTKYLWAQIEALQSNRCNILGIKKQLQRECMPLETSKIELINKEQYRLNSNSKYSNILLNSASLNIGCNEDMLVWLTEIDFGRKHCQYNLEKLCFPSWNNHQMLWRSAVLSLYAVYHWVLMEIQQTSVNQYWIKMTIAFVFQNVSSSKRSESLKMEQICTQISFHWPEKNSQLFNILWFAFKYENNNHSIINNIIFVIN